MSTKQEMDDETTRFRSDIYACFACGFTKEGRIESLAYQKSFPSKELAEASIFKDWYDSYPKALQSPITYAYGPYTMYF